MKDRTILIKGYSFADVSRLRGLVGLRLLEYINIGMPQEEIQNLWIIVDALKLLYEKYEKEGQLYHEDGHEGRPDPDQGS